MNARRTSDTLWAALRLPDLSLQLYLRGAAACEPTVLQENDNRRHVLSCNEAATKAGIKPGMPVSVAHALVLKLHICTRDPVKEAKALAGIAAWATQFTPTVSLASSGEVLIEISGCLRLFGGLRALSGRIRAGLAELGYGAIVAMAPTPTAALVLARAGIDTSIGDRHELRRTLAPRRLSLLGQPAQTVAMLAALGVHTIGDWLSLPRDGLARRFGQGFLDEIDRALGLLPDPRPPFSPPDHYSTSLELPAPVQETEPLLFAAKRLILELAGHLALRQLGITRLRLELGHAHYPATLVLLGLSAPSRDAGHLVTLLRERLATIELPEAVETLCLVAEKTHPLGSQNQALFADGRPSREERWRIIEHLRARLGAEAVHGLEMFPDHRPELAFRKSLPGRAGDGHCELYRPLWLLPRPRPMRADGLLPKADAPLTLLDGPERVETGWWDDFDVQRDYFVTRDGSGAKLWLFRERSDRKDWFLHGIFA
ncbi:MAG: DNA polymerase Y family protein [Betaproteobacteria bacterium]|nr:DNA polymerase Y family protein [Betaproteobacteria bacterium]